MIGVCVGVKSRLGDVGRSEAHSPPELHTRLPPHSSLFEQESPVRYPHEPSVQ